MRWTKINQGKIYEREWKNKTRNNFIKKELIKIYEDKKGSLWKLSGKEKTDHENERKEKVVKKELKILKRRKMSKGKR